jgi:hypothetical protein
MQSDHAEHKRFVNSLTRIALQALTARHYANVIVSLG